jgi:tRNA threonylcarbamoyladenosine biosynthesis protein TsaB
VRILAIDTATENCSAALWIDDHMLARESVLERGHAEHILPMIDALLAAAGVGLAQLDAIAFGRGPGAFTGVRLAASVTQGLAYGAELPVVPISDLQALAQRALQLAPSVERVLVCTDARMREVYWACFTRGAHGVAAAASEERVGEPATVRLPPSWQGGGAGFDVGAVGSGFGVYPQLNSLVSGAGIVLGQLLPRAEEIARLAVPEVAARRVFPPDQALPTYLRDDVVRPPRA